MSIFGRRSAVVGIVALLVLAGSLTARNVVRGAAGPGKAPAASAVNADWARFGNNSDNNRFSPLTQVNAGNASKLGVAWTMSEGPQQSTWETDPVVVNGIMYLTTNTDQVMAVNAATGKLVWKYTPKVDFFEAVSGGGGGVPTNRGVTVSNGTVYLLTFDNQLIGLQASTGEKVFSATVADPKQGYSETAPPTYWNGLLFIGSAESDAGLRGFVAAYDAKTGKQVWRYYTVPAPGHGWMPAKGGHGGGDVWMPQTIDTTTGILYFGTGNPSPDLSNAMRPGCNPNVDATVALNARTGTFLWAHTQVCPDLWDYDSHQPPMLFNVIQNGKTIRAVGQGNKSGYYWVFNARTGQTLAKSPALSKQTLPRPHPNAKGVTVCPGAVGGIEYSPAAYSPMAHAVYQPTLDLCMTYTIAPQDEVSLHRRGAVDIGGSIAPVKSPPQVGYMNAVDANTGKLLWQTKVAGPMVGGAVATAGNLVFSGSDDGHFYAFDTRNGKVLWKANLGVGFGAAPIAYAVNSVEYVAIAAGGASGVAAIDGAKTGGTFVVFKLNGAPVKQVPAVNTASVPTSGELPSLKGLTKLNSFMYADAKTHHVVIKLTAALTSANSGFNFDGYTKGQATFVVPLGWNVEWEFANKAGLPHSAALASNLATPPKLPIMGVGPVETANAVAGIGPGATQLVGFQAVLPGNDYLVCLVPGHIQTGMWDHFIISKTAKAPSITVK